MHDGMLCMHDGMLDAIDMLEMLCNIKFDTIHPPYYTSPKLYLCVEGRS